MSLRGFKYLRTQRVVALIVILTLTSTLFSVTAYSFLGFYNGFSGYLGEGNNIIAIYSQTSRTPFTGQVPIAIADNLTSMKGVVSISTETVTPCLINGKSIFVRGIVPQELSKLNQLIILEGDNLSLTETDSAIIGANVAHQLDLRPGDRILVLGVQTERFVDVQIKGVYQSGSSLDDELLVPLYVGQWLHGLSYDLVTLIRAQINPSETSATAIYQEIINRTTSTPTPTSSTTSTQTQQELQALLPLAQQNFNIQDIGVEGSLQLMANYMDHYGISKDTLIILSIVVLIFSSGAASIAITLFVKQHETETKVLRAIGVTSKKLKRDLFLRMMLWILAATIFGTITSAAVLLVFQKIAYLQVLSQTITFQLDPIIIVANFVLLSILVGVNLTRMELKQ